MTALFRTPARRIAFAAALSLLVHALLLWLPHITLPQTETPLPPLAAKLEALPKIAVQPRPRRIPKPKPPEPVVQPSTPEPKVLPAIDAESADGPASAVAAASAVEATPAASAVQETTTAEQQPPHPLPKHARLSFHVYKGAGGLMIGTVKQELDINGDEYTLKAVTRTVGLARMVKDYQLTQISRGKVDERGLKPGVFEEEKNNDGEKESIKATFDWSAHKALFSGGNSAELPDGAQDMLSIFYNLSQLPLNEDTFLLTVSNGKKLERYHFAIVAEEEEITSRLGKLKTLHLRKQHAKGESGFEIWLGLEYRLLPVKYRLIEPSGEVSGDIVISDIRVADE